MGLKSSVYQKSNQALPCGSNTRKSVLSRSFRVLRSEYDEVNHCEDELYWVIGWWMRSFSPVDEVILSYGWGHSLQWMRSFLLLHFSDCPSPNSKFGFEGLWTQVWTSVGLGIWTRASQFFLGHPVGSSWFHQVPPGSSFLKVPQGSLTFLNVP